MMQLDSTSVLLLGALFAVTILLVLGLGVGFGAAAWGWSWASRFDSVGAHRAADGTVELSAKLKPRSPKKVRRLVPPSNGVRRVTNGRALA